MTASTPASTQTPIINHGATFEEILLETVRLWPVLYDMHHPSYHVTQTKDAAWRVVMQKLIEMGFECTDVNLLIKRWKYLRDYYRKLKKDQEKKARSGAKASGRVKWPYYTRMAFLDDFSHKQSTSGNLQDFCIIATSPTTSEPSPCTSNVAASNENSNESVYDAGEDSDEPTHLPDLEYLATDIEDKEDANSHVLRQRRPPKRQSGCPEELLDIMKSTSRIIQRLDFSTEPNTLKKSKEQAFSEFVLCMLLEMDEPAKKVAMLEITKLLTCK